MIKCIAVDDEPLALKQIVSNIGKIPFLELVSACKSASEASKAIADNAVDVMFCDINMPVLNGLDYAKSLSPAPLVVFTTACSEYALEGYRVDAVDYLLKPFAFDDFKASVEKVRTRVLSGCRWLPLLQDRPQDSVRLPLPNCVCGGYEVVSENTSGQWGDPARRVAQHEETGGTSAVGQVHEGTQILYHQSQAHT